LTATPSAASTVLVAFLFAIFVAHWAQNTRRITLLWFLFGFVLPPVAGLVLLWKNGKQNQVPPRLEDPGLADLIATRKDIP
jgi:ABC-type molybdate transport system permease subunit